MIEQELYDEYRKSDCKSFTDFLINKITELKTSCKIQVDTAFQTIYEKDDQLNKAKEIIEKLYSHVFQGMGFMELNDFNVLKSEAEQFLKDSEVEK